MSAPSLQGLRLDKRVLRGATVAAAAALIFGSVQSTGALWRDTASTPLGTVTAGTLSLSTGAGSNPNYTFSALAKASIVPGDAVQKPLTITNTGSAPLAYSLTAAGPSVSAGPAVSVVLAGTVVASAALCTDTGTPAGPAAFTTFTAGTTGVAATSAQRPLAAGASEIWCIRSTLATASASAKSTFTLVFAFGAVST